MVKQKKLKVIGLDQLIQLSFPITAATDPLCDCSKHVSCMTVT